MLKQLAFCCILALAAPALAKDKPAPAMDMSAKPADTPATKEFKAEMATMDKGMGQYTGKTDRDFVVNMMAHHQAAIAMAQTELKYGTDQQLKSLAQSIVTTQNNEITFMNSWLAIHPAK